MQFASTHSIVNSGKACLVFVVCTIVPTCFFVQRNCLVSSLLKYRKLTEKKITITNIFITHNYLFITFWHTFYVFFFSVFLLEKKKKPTHEYRILVFRLLHIKYLWPPSTILVSSSHLQRKFLSWSEWVFSYLYFKM